MMTRRRWTETVREVQRSRASIGVLVVSVQSPGPCTGTSATWKSGESEPLSTPLETDSLGGAAAGKAFGAVTSAYFVLLAVGNRFTFEWWGVTGAVVVVVGVVATVVEVDVVVD